jgi:hypothetical protein
MLPDGASKVRGEKTEVRSSGVQEFWSVGVGVLECWSVGVLGCWGVGVLECWSVGVLGSWGVGVLECWSVGVLEVRDNGWQN